jgi:hypothetical protein
MMRVCLMVTVSACRDLASAKKKSRRLGTRNSQTTRHLPRHIDAGQCRQSTSRIDLALHDNRFLQSWQVIRMPLSLGPQTTLPNLRSDVPRPAVDLASVGRLPIAPPPTRTALLKTRSRASSGRTSVSPAFRASDVCKRRRCEGSVRP